MLKLLSIPAVLFLSFSLQATTTVETWDFTRNSQVTVNNSSSLTIQSNQGNQAIMTAWSAENAGGLVNQSSFYLNGWGTNVNGHGVDNFAGSQFILLEFTQPVELTSLISSWNAYYSSNGSLNTAVDAYLTVAGFDNPFSASQNWSDIAQSTSIKSAYQNSTVVEPGSSINSFRDAKRQTTFVDNQLINHNTGNTGISGEARKTWLIGAYNHVFNATNSPNFNGFDTLKFSSLTTSFNTPVSDVPVPATLGLFGLGLMLMLKRRKLLTR